MQTSVSPVQENYIETILKLSQKNGAARVRDIAGVLSVHKSTVTAALRSLAERNLVNYTPYEHATLTEHGRRIGEQLSRSHTGIRRFLTDVLLLDEKTANANACRMEHVMDPQVLERLDRFSEFFHARALPAGKWAESFGGFLNPAKGHPKP